MATINSHRRRQAFHRDLDRASYSRYWYTNSPSGAATMMPSKATQADGYTAWHREFANLSIKLRETYTGRTLRSEYDRTTNMHFDRIRTVPGGMINVNDPNSPMRYISRGNGSPPVIYSTDITAPGGFLNYSRKNNGILLGSYTTYKKVNNQYQHVIDIGGHLGGNIKSRQAAFKWIGGMWREKK